MKRSSLLIALVVTVFASNAGAFLETWTGRRLVCTGEDGGQEMALSFSPSPAPGTLSVAFSLYSPGEKQFLDVRRDLQARRISYGRVLIAETQNRRSIGALTPLSGKIWQYNAGGLVWNCQMVKSSK